MAKEIPFKVEAYLSDWNPYSNTDGTFTPVTNISVSQWRNRVCDPCIEIITPTNPDFVGTFRVNPTSWTGQLFSGTVRVWISTSPGGTALNSYNQSIDETNGGQWSFSITNERTLQIPGQPPALIPSTIYYVNFQANRAGERGAKQTDVAGFQVRAKGTFPAYLEVPPPPPPPEPPEPPEPPPEPPEPPTEPPTEPPPPSTGGENNPPTGSTPDPDFGTPSSPTPTTSVTDIQPPKGKAVANEASRKATVLITENIPSQLGFGVPEPRADAEALYKTVEGLKVFQEQITRQRGDRTKSAVLVEELPTILEELVRELDKRYASAYVEVEVPTTDANAPQVVTNVSELASEFTTHITNTATHITEPPATGVWGRRRGAWQRVPSFSDITQYLANVDIPEPTIGESVIDTERGGFISTFVVAETVTAGQVCNINATGQMALADASAAANSSSLLGIALENGILNGEVQFLLNGYYALSGFTTGEQLYLDPAVPGGLTVTVPSGSLNVVRVTGYATASTEVYFNPDRTWIVLA